MFVDPFQHLGMLVSSIVVDNDMDRFANGCRLTANGTIMAVRYLLTNARLGGYYTPSTLLGARCVEQLPGSSSIRVE